MITKKQAHLLAAYEFKLVDKNGVIITDLRIKENNDKFIGKIKDAGFSWSIPFKFIGSSYFILCRPYSQLTEEIEHGGERFVPMELLGYVNEKYSLQMALKYICSDKIESKDNDNLLTWNFKPQWLDKKFVKYINQ